MPRPYLHAPLLAPPACGRLGCSRVGPRRRSSQGQFQLVARAGSTRLEAGGGVGGRRRGSMEYLVAFRLSRHRAWVMGQRLLVCVSGSRGTPLGGFWKAVSRPLGGRLGASRSLLGASWGPLGGFGASWGVLGGLWGPLGALLGPPGAPGGGKLFLRLNCRSPSWPFLGTSEPDGVRTCACPLVATSPAAALPPPPCAGVPRGASAHRAWPGPTGPPPASGSRAGLIR